jgi:hypothetical protein
MATQVACTISSGVSVEPPTNIISLPHSMAIIALFAAVSGSCFAGSIKVMCLVEFFFEDI